MSIGHNPSGPLKGQENAKSLSQEGDPLVLHTYLADSLTQRVHITVGLRVIFFPEIISCKGMLQMKVDVGLFSVKNEWKFSEIYIYKL